MVVIKPLVGNLKCTVTPFKGRVIYKFIFGFHWECRARQLLIILFGRHFVGEKCYPKQPTATRTFCVLVAVDLDGLHVTSLIVEVEAFRK